jgi:hypothetical protein
MKSEPNWYRIELLMEKSFDGSGLTSAEQSECEAAHRTNPGHYGQLSRGVRARLIAEKQAM